MSAQTADVMTAPKLEVPLVVDVDGALVATDLLQEAALQYAVQYPLQAFRILYWLVDGKSNLKIELANCIDPGIETVPLARRGVSADPQCPSHRPFGIPRLIVRPPVHSEASRTDRWHRRRFWH